MWGLRMGVSIQTTTIRLTPDQSFRMAGAIWRYYQDADGNPKVPDALATLAYDSTNLLLTAIEKAGVDDPAKVAEVMAGIKFDAVSGTITFDAQHNPVKNAVVIGVSGGNKYFVESVEP